MTCEEFEKIMVKQADLFQETRAVRASLIGHACGCPHCWKRVLARRNKQLLTATEFLDHLTKWGEDKQDREFMETMLLEQEKAKRRQNNEA